MVRTNLLAVGFILLFGRYPTATIIIEAPKEISFRTMGFPRTNRFTGPRTFKLPPGEYVIVQAPPTQTLQITCDDESPFVHQLAAGDVVHCNYSL